MEKRFKNGLCLGKFMPIHNGHIHMIREAAKLCETVHVMVCSRLCEPIDGKKRFDWAQDVFQNEPNINVIHCDDENPQYPEDNENFWDIWYNSVYSYVEELDAVFASENYVYPFAECLKVEPILVDVNRNIVPISGTEIRTNPFNNWKFIPSEVKEEYRLKISVVGPESSGKTTLCNDLSKYFDGMIVEEYGRTYTNNIVSTKDLKPHDFAQIASEHHINILMAERKANINDSKYIFIDTDANVTRTFLGMYSKLYNWNEHPVYRDEVSYYNDKIEEYIELQMMKDGLGSRSGKIDLYLLTYPDLDWEDDGTRDFEELKDRMNSFNWIKAQLDIHNCKYHIITGKGDNRTDKAIKIINNSEKEFREKPWHKLSFDK